MKNKEKKETFSRSETLRFMGLSSLLTFILTILVIVTFPSGAIEKQIKYLLSEKVILANGNKVATEYNYKNEKWKEHIYSKEGIKIKEIIFRDYIASEEIYFDQNEKRKYLIELQDDATSFKKEIFYFNNETPKIITDYSFYVFGSNILEREITYYKSGSPKTIVSFNYRSRWIHTKCFDENRIETKCQLDIHNCTNTSRSCINKKEIEELRNQIKNEK